jgi:hypothetical protein
MKINKKAILGTVLAAGCVANTAMADMITYTDTFGPQTTPFTDVETFTKFNTALGTLTGIQIVLDTYATATVQIANTTGTPQPFTDAQATIPVTATALNGVSTTTSTVAGPFSGTAPTGISEYPGITGSASSTLSVPMADFGLYEGMTAGTYNVSVTGGLGTYQGSAAFGVLFGGTASAGGTLEVIYDYNTPSPVPDSGVTILLGGVAIGMIVVSQKLRKQGQLMAL